MRMYLDFIPPLSAWIVPLGVLALFLSLAELGTRRRWTRPSALAVWGVWTLIGIGVFLRNVGTSEPTSRTHVLPPSVRTTTVMLVGAFVLLGAAASGFDRARPRSPTAGIVGALVAGTIAVPIALIAALLLACALDLGCV